MSLYKVKIVLMPLNQTVERAHKHAIFGISLRSVKLINLSFGLRPNNRRSDKALLSDSVCGLRERQDQKVR